MDAGLAVEGENLWSSILDSVDSGSRAAITKNLIILGNRQTGKSTLINRLSSSTGEAPTAPIVNSNLELGLSYSVLDVPDRDESAARLGIYQLPSPLPPYPALLPLALPNSSILDTLLIITLDWTKPWLFVKELKNWIAVLESMLQQDTNEKAEGQNRLETIFRQYEKANPDGTTKSSIGPDTLLPPGMLTNNLGVGIVIVCTKSDQMNQLERENQLNEDQFEYVQQVLRTIALKYGAALFYTSHNRPETFVKLREYLLHRLYSPPLSTSLPPTSTQQSPPTTTSTSSALLAASAFPFTRSAEFTDRDAVLIPAGWDNEGLIAAAASTELSSTRFVPSTISNGWDLDLRREIIIMKGEDLEESDLVGSDGKMLPSAESMYDSVVIDVEFSTESSSKAPSNLLALENQQDFLRAQFASMEEVRKKDPRNAFTTRPSDIITDRPDRSALVKNLVSNKAKTSPIPVDQPTLKSPALVSPTEMKASASAADNVVLSNFFSSLLKKPAAEKNSMSRSSSSSKIAEGKGSVTKE